MSQTHEQALTPLKAAAILGGGVLAAALVFSLGVMTGKRVAEGLPAAGDADRPAGVPPTPPAAAAPLSATSLTFYDRLSGAAPATPVVLPERQAAPADSAPAVSAASAPAAARQAVPSAGAAPSPGLAAQIKKLTGKGPYTVQIAAVTDRAAATEAAARVKTHGLEVATITAPAKGKKWYRLRVGSFPNRQAAEKAAGIFRTEMGFDATPVRR